MLVGPFGEDPSLAGSGCVFLTCLPVQPGSSSWPPSFPVWGMFQPRFGQGRSALSLLSLLHFVQTQHIVLVCSFLLTLSIPLLCASSLSAIPNSPCCFLSLFSFPVLKLPLTAACSSRRNPQTICQPFEEGLCSSVSA